MYFFARNPHRQEVSHSSYYPSTYSVDSCKRSQHSAPGSILEIRASPGKWFHLNIYAGVLGYGAEDQRAIRKWPLALLLHIQSSVRLTWTRHVKDLLGNCCWTGNADDISGPYRGDWCLGLECPSAILWSRRQIRDRYLEGGIVVSNVRCHERKDQWRVW